MSFTSDDDKRRAFKILHKPDRPIYHIGHARRGNSAEDYDSAAIREAGDRLLDGNMKTARGVADNFEKNSKKKS